MQEILQNPTFVLFAILFFGLCLGNLSVKGIALGTSGVGAGDGVVRVLRGSGRG